MPHRLWRCQSHDDLPEHHHEATTGPRSRPSVGTLDRPVLDQTGLRGAYDFSITWVPGPWNRQQPAAPAEGMASAPTGEISFFEAMEKQLGIKLTKQKLPYPALVVDSVERPKDQ